MAEAADNGREDSAEAIRAAALTFPIRRARRRLPSCWRSRRIRSPRSRAVRCRRIRSAHARSRATPPPPRLRSCRRLTSVKRLHRPTPASLTEPAPAKRNANGERSLTRVLGLKLGRVVIDPGHGGHDVGTHGASGRVRKRYRAGRRQAPGRAARRAAGQRGDLHALRRYLRCAGTADPDRQRSQGRPVSFDPRQFVAVSLCGRRGDVLSELHHFEGGAGRGGAREREFGALGFRFERPAAKDRAEGQDRRIARVRHADREFAVRAVVEEPIRAEKIAA